MEPTEHLPGKLWTVDHAKSGGGPETYFVTGASVRPSRGGWTTLEFFQDGRFTRKGPGPDDRPVTRSGDWIVDSDRPSGVRLEFEDPELKFVVRIVDEQTIALAPDPKSEAKPNPHR